MVSTKDLIARAQAEFRFSKLEIIGILVAVVVAAFVFSFRDWGVDTFDAVVGVKNLCAVILIAAISFFFRITCQKLYGLAEGHKAEFKIFWAGILITLLVGFFSAGHVPLVLLGTIFTSFMVRQRVGEMRYGLNYWVNGMTAYWGPMANMILAIFFGVGLYFLPQSYFFSKGLVLNIIMAICSMIPIPQLDGLTIFMGSRGLYYTGIVVILLGSLLLLTKTAIGLIIIVLLGGLYFGVWKLIRSEK